MLYLGESSGRRGEQWCHFSEDLSPAVKEDKNSSYQETKSPCDTYQRKRTEGECAAGRER